MNFLKKLKGVFEREGKGDKRLREESVEESDGILLNEIESKLRTKEENILKYLEKDVGEMYDKILPILERLGEDIRVLDEKDVSKIRDDPRLKQITEIGKRDFLHQSRELRDRLMQKKSGEEAIIYINQEIKKFIKYSHISYTKTTYLIGEEARKIKEDINEIIRIEEALVDISLKNTKHREEIKKILDSIDELNEGKNKITDFKVKIKEARTTIISQREKISEIEEDIEKIKGGQKFKDNKEILDELKSKEDELRKEENEFKTLIDSKLLEKNLYYEVDKMKVKIMEDYLKDPVENLIKDNGLNIYGILEDTRRRIINKEIVMKDSEKILKKLDFKREVLLATRGSLVNLKRDLRGLRKRLETLDLGLVRLESERLDLLNKINEKEEILVSLIKKEGVLEKESEKKEEKIRLDFRKIINIE